MPNSLTATGLTTSTQTELVANFTAAAQAIYGSDINLAASTPDGQWMMTFIQAVIDIQDLLTTIYNFFDPDQAVGVILDQRVAINGIQRQAGTFTVQNVTLVTSQSVNLYGLDQVNTTGNRVYTVQDSAGNQWQLQTTQLGLVAGTSVLAFQAANPGAVLTTPNTITIPVTIVLGVVSINNPTPYTTLGINEEADATLKIRRQQSVALASQGYLAGLLAALENINGVTSAFVYENNTNAFDGISPDAAYPNGTPSHSIWVIVSGSAAASDIAQAIYTKRNAGCGMRGETSFIVTQVDGSSFILLWDTVSPENLFIAFYVSSLNGTTTPNIADIVEDLPEIFVPGVAAEVNINELATLVQKIDPNSLVTFSGAQIPATGGFATSVGGAYSNTLSPTSKKNQFVVTSANIIVLPMILSPSTVSVAPLASVAFQGLGGYGTLTYAFVTNNSGGTLNTSTGAYTAGSTPNVTDTLRVTDGLGNTANAVITVT